MSISFYPVLPRFGGGAAATSLALKVCTRYPETEAELAKLAQDKLAELVQKVQALAVADVSNVTTEHSERVRLFRFTSEGIEYEFKIEDVLSDRDRNIIVGTQDKDKSWWLSYRPGLNQGLSGFNSPGPAIDFGFTVEDATGNPRDDLKALYVKLKNAAGEGSTPEFDNWYLADSLQ